MIDTERKADVFLRLCGLPPYELEDVIEALATLDEVREQMTAMVEELSDPPNGEERNG